MHAVLVGLGATEVDDGLLVVGAGAALMGADAVGLVVAELLGAGAEPLPEALKTAGPGNLYEVKLFQICDF